MKKKISFWLGVGSYIVAFLVIVGYFLLGNNRILPSGRVMLLSSCCFMMYVGGILLIKSDEEKYRNRPLKINMAIYCTLYVSLLLTLTLFDSYFNRSGFSNLNWGSQEMKNYLSHSLNLIPFHTIMSYVVQFMQGKVSTYVFSYNIIGNLVAFMPFSFFLPLLIKRQEKFSVFFLTMLGIVVGIELSQLITMSGACDIDDVILNVAGACILHVVLQIHGINEAIKRIFLWEKEQK